MRVSGIRIIDLDFRFTAVLGWVLGGSVGFRDGCLRVAILKSRFGKSIGCASNHLYYYDLTRGGRRQLGICDVL